MLKNNTSSENSSILKLRFPDFSGEWEGKKFSDILETVSTKSYQIYNSNILIFGKNKVVDQSMDLIAGYSNDDSKVFKNTPVIVFGDHTTVLKYIDFQFIVGADGTKVLTTTETRNNLKFLFYSLLNNPVRLEGYRRHYSVLKERNILLPSLYEQEKIADFLQSTDYCIENLKEQKKSLEKYKKGIMQKIFAQEIRFKDRNGKYFSEWKEKKLGEILDYEQPTNYIVESTEYKDEYIIPVLTAGKTFILGYTNETEGIFKSSNLPVIIFDDFTTTSQFVDFSFKVKSSAMKILKAKKNIDIKLIYEVMQFIKYEIGGHGRHWISKYSKIKIKLPSFPEQQKIAAFLTSVDKLLESKQQQIAKAEEWKKGLMQGLFV